MHYVFLKCQYSAFIFVKLGLSYNKHIRSETKKNVHSIMHITYAILTY